MALALSPIASKNPTKNNSYGAQRSHRQAAHVREDKETSIKEEDDSKAPIEQRENNYIDS